MCQINGAEGTITDELRRSVAAGQLGSVLNEVDRETVIALQQIAMNESRLGIPLLFGRDVIHGFRTILPIPLGQAASWDPELVQAGARWAAREASVQGVHWTFAPMIDIARDPRWGRIAESLGEDPYLTSVLGVAMVKGFQGDDLTASDAIAACVKHFAGYGASESGKDYNTTNIPENELRNIYLRPFKAAVQAGVCSLMASFSDLDGVPATANRFLLTDILRNEWGFDGFVVSDWDAVRQLSVHGLTEDDRASAFEAVTAGIDMEMASTTFARFMTELVETGTVPISAIDASVTRILEVKFRLGLFDLPSVPSVEMTDDEQSAALELARRVAVESTVLLKNDNATLPLDPAVSNKIAVIGPLADDPYEQLGTWIFDGDVSLSVTGLQAIRQMVRGAVTFEPALTTSRDRDPEGIARAVEAVREASVAILFLGEESILSGEAHCRTDLDLPGAQVELVRRIRKVGKPVVAVISAGRPLTLSTIVDDVDALLYAWHGGAMAGPAIADLIFGRANPSGKLPVSFPRNVGQIPLYYNHKQCGRPPSAESMAFIDDIPVRPRQTSLGMTAYHLDVHPSPLFAFGFGLSYTLFSYDNIVVSSARIPLGEPVTVSAEVTNAGEVAGVEVVQLYVRDLVGSTTRPIR
ncbi:MAG: glycoside hydrolase family 3 N-terminal domain-containing protein, partial [Myxococcota bacterium]